MRRKMKMRGMGDEPMSKLEVLDKYPKIAEALQQYAAEKQSGSGRMIGGSWWGDFVDWLKRNKVISSASKIGATIATAFGAVPLATALTAVSAGSSAIGYGYVNNLSKIGSKRTVMGKGAIYSQNGMLVKQPRQSGGRMMNMMGGATTQMNAVYTEQSKVQF
jgi:hypothetical protein